MLTMSPYYSMQFTLPHLILKTTLKKYSFKKNDSDCVPYSMKKGIPFAALRLYFLVCKMIFIMSDLLKVLR